MDETNEKEVHEVDTTNEYGLSSGKNLPNNTHSMKGQATFIKPMTFEPPIFRTKQSAYRFAGWLLTMAEVLPDEPGAHTLEQITQAIRNT
jgi:hypothetical protein